MTFFDSWLNAAERVGYLDSATKEGDTYTLIGNGKTLNIMERFNDKAREVLLWSKAEPTKLYKVVGSGIEKILPRLVVQHFTGLKNVTFTDHENHRHIFEDVGFFPVSIHNGMVRFSDAVGRKWICSSSNVPNVTLAFYKILYDGRTDMSALMLPRLERRDDVSVLKSGVGGKPVRFIEEPKFDDIQVPESYLTSSIESLKQAFPNLDDYLMFPHQGDVPDYGVALVSGMAVSSADREFIRSAERKVRGFIGSDAFKKDISEYTDAEWDSLTEEQQEAIRRNSTPSRGDNPNFMGPGHNRFGSSFKRPVKSSTPYPDSFERGLQEGRVTDVPPGGDFNSDGQYVMNDYGDMYDSYDGLKMGGVDTRGQLRMWKGNHPVSGRELSSDELAKLGSRDANGNSDLAADAEIAKDFPYSSLKRSVSSGRDALPAVNWMSELIDLIGESNALSLRDAYMKDGGNNPDLIADEIYRLTGEATASPFVDDLADALEKQWFNELEDSFEPPRSTMATTPEGEVISALKRPVKSGIEDIHDQYVNGQIGDDETAQMITSLDPDCSDPNSFLKDWSNELNLNASAKLKNVVNSAKQFKFQLYDSGAFHIDTGQDKNGVSIFSSVKGFCDAGPVISIAGRDGYSYNDLLAGVDLSQSFILPDLKKHITSGAKLNAVKSEPVSRRVVSWVVSGKELDAELTLWGLSNPGRVFQSLYVLGVDLDGKSTFKSPVKSSSLSDAEFAEEQRKGQEAAAKKVSDNLTKYGNREGPRNTQTQDEYEAEASRRGVYVDSGGRLGFQMPTIR